MQSSTPQHPRYIESSAMLSESKLQETNLRHLLLPEFQKILAKQLEIAEMNDCKKPSCLLSYAWPCLAEDQSAQIHSRVFRIMEDCHAAGIDPHVDIEDLTLEALRLGTVQFENLDQLLAAGLANSQHVLMLGSPSYRLRASQDGSYTYQEVNAFLEKMDGSDGLTVFPIALSGTFMTAFPDSEKDKRYKRFTETLGADFTTAEGYLKSFPAITARIHGLEEDSDWKLAYAAYLAELGKLSTEAKAEVLDVQKIHSIQERSVSEIKQTEQKLQVRIAQLTPKIRRQLDGALMQSLKKINLKINEIAKQMPIQSPESELGQAIKHHQAESRLLENSAQLLLEESLQKFYQTWGVDSPQAFLLEGPDNTGKRNFLRCLELQAWQTWQVDPLQLPLPIYVNMSQLKSSKSEILIEVLLSWGLTLAEIELVKTELRCLILIDGLTVDNLNTNYWVRNGLDQWHAKVVYRYADVCENPQLKFYLMPNRKQHPWEDGLLRYQLPQSLRRDSWDQTLWQRQSESMASTASLAVGVGLSVVATETKSNSTVALSAVVAAPEQYYPDKVEALLRRFREATIQKHIGRLYLLEQKHTLQLHALLQKFHEAVSAEQPITHQAFISYSWPSGVERTMVQTRLRRLVKDCKVAGIKALFDIEQLIEGVHINTFMEEGIRGSDIIFLIGLPISRTQVRFKQDGTPETNAAFEFKQILDKHKTAETLKSPVYCLRLRDKDECGYPDAALENFSQRYDFTNEENYYRDLPGLLIHVLNLEENTVCVAALKAYQQTRELIELQITDQAIYAGIQDAETAQEKDRLAAQASFQGASAKLKDMDAKLYDELTRATQDRLQVSLEKLSEMTESMQPDSFFGRELEKYVPIQGSLDSDPDEAAKSAGDLEQMMCQFWEDGQNSKILLLEGPSGGGKSLLLRHIEQSQWQRWLAAKNRQDCWLPLVINLPQMGVLQPNLIERALARGGVPDDVIESMKRHQIKLDIKFDGLDEVPLSALNPATSFLAGNDLSSWAELRITIGCRREQVAVLEAHLKQSLSRYFSFGSGAETYAVETFYITPFKTEQVEKFLEQFCKSADSVWETAEEYQQHLESISGLKDLIKTPFILNMICQALPVLNRQATEQPNKLSGPITRTDVYQAFMAEWFHKEMWRRVSSDEVPQTVNLPFEWQQKCEDWTKTMLIADTSQLSVEQAFLGLSEDEQIRYLKACPVKLAGKVFSFNHKSVQEYTMAARLLRELRLDFASTVSCWQGFALLQQESIMRFLAEMLTKEDEKRLWELVYASREQESLAGISAISITLLNMRGVSFSGLNLSDVRIPGADMSSSVCQRTNFTGADLTAVNFANSYLLGAIFDNANMQGVFIDAGRGEFIKGNFETFSTSPNCRNAVFFGPDYCSLFALEDGRELLRLKDIEKATMSHDGKLIVLTGDRSAAAVLWSCEEQCEQARVEVEGLGDAEFSPDGEQLFLMGGKSGLTVVWSCSEQHELKRIDIARLRSATLSPDREQLVLTGSESEKAVLWSIKERREIDRVAIAGCHTATYSPNGNVLVLRTLTTEFISSNHGSVDYESSVVWFPDERGDRISVVMNETKPIFSVDGKLLVLTGDGYRSDTVLWSCDKKCELAKFKVLTKATFSTDGQLLALTGERSYNSENPVLWSCEEAREIEGVEMDEVSEVVFSPDSKFLVLMKGSYDRQSSKLWSREQKRESGWFDDIEKIIFSPDGGLLVLIGNNRTNIVIVWSCVEMKELIRLEDINDAIFSPDGQLLILTQSDGKAVVLWSCKDMCKVGLVEGEDLSKTFFSADNQLLVLTGYSSTSVVLWSCNEVHELGRVEGEGLSEVTFSLDNQLVLLSGYGEKSIVLWSCVLSKEVGREPGCMQFLDLSTTERTFFLLYDPEARFSSKLWDGGDNCLHKLNETIICAAQCKNQLILCSNNLLYQWDSANNHLVPMSDLAGVVKSINFIDWVDSKRLLLFTNIGGYCLWDWQLRETESGEQRILVTHPGHNLPIKQINHLVPRINSDRTEVDFVTVAKGGKEVFCWYLQDKALRFSSELWNGRYGDSTMQHRLSSGHCIGPERVMIFDYASAHAVRKVTLNKVFTHSVFSSNGEQLVLVGGDDESALLWSNVEMRELTQLDGLEGATFNSDGQLQELKEDGEMLWSADEEGENRNSRYGRFSASKDCFSPDGKLRVQLSHREVVIWSCEENCEISRVDMKHLGRHRSTVKPLSCQFSSDSKFLVLMEADSDERESVVLWSCELKSEFTRKRITGMQKVVFSPNSQYVVLLVRETDFEYGDRIEAQLWSCVERECVISEKNGIRTANFSSDSKLLILSGDRKIILLSPEEEMKQLGWFDLNSDELDVAVLSQGEQLLALTAGDYHDSSPVVWSCVEKRELAHITKGIYKISIFFHEGRLLLLAGEPGIEKSACMISFAEDFQMLSVPFIGQANIKAENEEKAEKHGDNPFGRYLAISNEIETRIYFLDQERPFIKIPYAATDAILVPEPESEIGDISEKVNPKYAITTGNDCTLRLWDVSNLENIILVNCSRGLRLMLEQNSFDGAKNVSATNERLLDKKMLSLPALPPAPNMSAIPLAENKTESTLPEAPGITVFSAAKAQSAAVAASAINEDSSTCSRSQAKPVKSRSCAIL